MCCADYQPKKLSFLSRRRLSTRASMTRRPTRSPTPTEGRGRRRRKGEQANHPTLQVVPEALHQEERPYPLVPLMIIIFKF
jgi:hypothetical protein